MTRATATTSPSPAARNTSTAPTSTTCVEDCNGANAFLDPELDLTTDDGLKDYGTCTVTIFLLTVDQYRRNRDVIPNADDWWWLSTAFSTEV
ncbi:MAG: hypothetical protein ACLU38_04180 [Dysosmobacter sp.]